MYGLPPSVSITKDDNVVIPYEFSLSSPPVITRTAATPMVTPQSSPGEFLCIGIDVQRNLTVEQSDDKWVRLKISLLLILIVYSIGIICDE